MSKVNANGPLVFRNFERLGRKDRSAILAHLSEDERQAVQEAVAAERRAKAEEKARIRQSDRQFLAYSAWLASLIEASIKCEEVALTPATRDALTVEHQAALAGRKEQEVPIAQSIMNRLRALVSPAERGTE
jgi:predicted Rdx family selenoprotein